MEKELKPFIETRYPVDVNNQLLMGHSLSGLFALNTMLDGEGKYQGFVIGSPSIWWNSFEVLADSEKIIQRLNQMNGAIYLAIGELEGDVEPYKSLSSFDVLTNIISRTESNKLKYQFEVFEGETHVSSQARLIVSGLRSVLNQ